MIKSSIANALFTKTQQQVLGLLFGQPDKRRSYSEIVKHTGLGMGTVHRELAKLASSGLICEQRMGNQRLLFANPDSPIFDELRAIATKVLGVAQVLAGYLEPILSEIEDAYIFGSVAKGTDTAQSDVDLIIIGNADYMEIMSVVAQAQEKLGRQVNVEILTPEEVAEMSENNDPVWQRISEGPKIPLIEREHATARTVQSARTPG